MRSPLKALYIITPAIGRFFKGPTQLPGEHTAELQVEISAAGYTNTDTFSAG
jgi:hypothetical protein